MSNRTNAFDLLVLGAGPGGVAAATDAAANGMNVAVINDGHFLGHSLEGAFKSKALYDISRIHFASHRYSRHFRPLFDFFEAYHTNQMSADSLRSLEARKLTERGITYIQGRGQFVSAHEIGVGHELYWGKNIIIATGTRPRILDGIRPSKQQILTFDDIINIARPLRSLLILGAGVVGCEFASIFAALGITVKMVESKPRIFAHEDPDVSRLLTHCLEDLGVEIFSGTHCQAMTPLEEGVATLLDGNRHINTDATLLSVGRTPNSDTLNLLQIGVTIDPYGFIKTNEAMQTSVPHIYAIGDVATRVGKRILRLVRLAELEAEVAVAGLRGESHRLMTNYIPFTIFTHPTIAGAGLSELEARQLFGNVRVGKWPHIRNHRAHMMPSQKGFTKLIVGPMDDDRILGVRAIGEGADSIVSEVSMMLQFQLPFTHLLNVPRAYPSFAESLRGAARVIARLEAPCLQDEEFAYELAGF